MTTFCSSSARSAAKSSIAVLLLTLAGVLAAPSFAEAGTYTARLCAEGFTQSGDKGPFERGGNDVVFSLANNCGDFNGLRVSHNAGEPGADEVEARWIAERPDGIAVKRIAYRASGHRAGGYFPHVVGALGGSQGLEILDGDARLTEEFADYRAEGDFRRFGVRLICQTDGSSCGSNPDQPEARLKNVVYTLSDPERPTIGITGGSVFEGPVQSGGESVAFDATDAGSGVRRVLVIVNGTVVARKGANCAIKQGDAQGMKPCPPSFKGLIDLKTGAGPWRDGRNSVRVCAEDVSSEGDANRTCTPGSRVRVLNGCAMNTAPPASLAEALRLGWPGNRNAAAQTRQGRIRTATARLFGPAGEPLAGARVCFSRTVPGGPGERLVDPGVVTDVDGHASTKVRGASSRSVWATYWAGPEAALTKRISLRVSPRIRLELRPNDRIELGEKMRVVALLGGKWRAGRKVCFYAERPGSNRIGCDKTGSGGRARLGYEPPEPGKVGFFAKVPNQKDYPFANGRSKVKKLVVERG